MFYFFPKKDRAKHVFPVCTIKFTFHCTMERKAMLSWLAGSPFDPKNETSVLTAQPASDEKYTKTAFRLIKVHSCVADIGAQRSAAGRTL
jgi:hypothetical protein